MDQQLKFLTDYLRDQRQNLAKAESIVESMFYRVVPADLPEASAHRE